MSVSNPQPSASFFHVGLRIADRHTAGYFPEKDFKVFKSYTLRNRQLVKQLNTSMLN